MTNIDKKIIILFIIEFIFIYISNYFENLYTKIEGGAK